jgi:hypothetical protein
VGDAVERAYRRGDALEKRRELMDAWANLIGGTERFIEDMVHPTKHEKTVHYSPRQDVIQAS